MKKQRGAQIQKNTQNEKDDSHYLQAALTDQKYSVFNRKQIRKQKKIEKKQMHIKVMKNNLLRKQNNHQLQENENDKQQNIEQVIQMEQKQDIKKKKKVNKSKKRQSRLQREIEEEDKEIEKLQAKLGLKNKRLTKRMIIEDGYDDDLFDLLDHIDNVAAVKSLASEEYQKFKERINKDDDACSNQESQKEEFDLENYEEESYKEDQQELDEEQSDDDLDQNENIDDNIDIEQLDSNEQIDLMDSIVIEKKPIIQNQSVLKQQIQPTEVQKQSIEATYQEIPTDPDLEKLLKRNLNKLSESNIDNIFAEINKLYEQNPKQVVNQILGKIFINSSIEQVNILQFLVSCNSTVICGIHQIYGDISFGEFIKQITQSYQRNIKDEEKQLFIKNMSLVLSNWYLLESISLDFIKEYLSELLNHITPIITESIIIIIQYCGKKIRTENPGSLKIIIDEIKEKIQEFKTQDEQQKSKMNFLIMTLNDLKANKKLNNDPAERMLFFRNWIKSQVISKLQLAKQMFPIGFRNCLTSKFENLRWWQPINHLKNQETNIFDDFLSNKMKFSVKKQAELESLAIQQKMITETRKIIFKIIMGADDIYEASQNLLRLNLLRKSRSDICTVILELCGNEKQYNPYYAFLSEQLILMERGIKQSLQYAFWDKFKIMTELKVNKISNLAQFLSQLFLKKELTLNCIKWFQWENLNEKQIFFLQLLFWNYLNKTTFERLQELCEFKQNEESQVLKENIISFIKTNFKAYVVNQQINQEQEQNLIKMTKQFLKLLQM